MKNKPTSSDATKANDRERKSLKRLVRDNAIKAKLVKFNLDEFSLLMFKKTLLSKTTPNEVLLSLKKLENLDFIAINKKDRELKVAMIQEYRRAVFLNSKSYPAYLIEYEKCSKWNWMFNSKYKFHTVVFYFYPSNQVENTEVFSIRKQIAYALCRRPLEVEQFFVKTKLLIGVTDPTTIGKTHLPVIEEELLPSLLRIPKGNPFLLRFIKFLEEVISHHTTK